MAKRPTYLDKYNDIIQDQLQQGIIGELPTTLTPHTGTFLSHHAVINESKKQTKIRLVYNGSARVHDAPSLKDCLYRGSVLLPDLSSILLRIRFAPILLISDMEKAYLMVGLETCDRHFTKFLWLLNHHKLLTSNNIVAYCFQRVSFGLICSAFLFSATIHLHPSRAATPLSNEILESCYVDNIFLSASSRSEAIQKYQDTKSLFLLAGGNAREWTSSDAEVNNDIQALEKAPVDRVTKLARPRMERKRRHGFHSSSLLTITIRPSNKAYCPQDRRFNLRSTRACHSNNCRSQDVPTKFMESTTTMG